MPTSRALFCTLSHRKSHPINRRWSKVKRLKEKLNAKNEALSSAHADLVQYKAKKTKLINDYMASQEFSDLMTKQDETIFPAHFSIGWNAAIKAIKEKFLEVEPADFKSPENPIFFRQLLDGLSD